jgi:hypothetical protein
VPIWVVVESVVGLEVVAAVVDEVAEEQDPVQGRHWE